VKEIPYTEALATLRELRERRHPGPALAAFDGDGTLWSGDVGEDFLEHLLDEDAFTDVAAALFHDEATTYGVAREVRPKAQLATLFRAYVDGTYPEDRVCAVIALAVAGRPSSDVTRVAADVVRAKGVAGRLHDETVGVLEAARASGVEVVLVSASPRPVVVAAAELLGLGEADVIAVTCVEERGVLGGSLLEPMPYGEGKAACLRSRLAGRPLLVSCGDNAFDMAMLALAELPLAIRPKDRLRAIAHELPALAVLGRVG